MTQNLDCEESHSSPRPKFLNVNRTLHMNSLNIAFWVAVGAGAVVVLGLGVITLDVTRKVKGHIDTLLDNMFKTDTW